MDGFDLEEQKILKMKESDSACANSNYTKKIKKRNLQKKISKNVCVCQCGNKAESQKASNQLNIIVLIEEIVSKTKN